jgi:hypothetical protein
MKYVARAAGCVGWRRLMFCLLCVSALLPVQALMAAQDTTAEPAGSVAQDPALRNSG